MGSTTLRADLANLIKAMPAGLKVHVVGRTTALSTSVYNSLKALPNVASIERISGADRYGTAAAVATKMKSVLGAAFPKTVFIANGNLTSQQWDALTAATVSAKLHYPVLLVTDTSVPAVTSSVLSSLGLSTRYIVGNTTAVSNSVRITLGVSTANQISGANRAATAVAFANKAKSSGWLSTSSVGFANAFSDAFTARPFMRKLGGPLLWVDATSIPTSTSSFLTGNKANIHDGYAFGGTGVLSNTVMTSLFNLIK